MSKLLLLILALFTIPTASGQTSGELESLGTPVDQHGIPSTNVWREGGLLYGEARDPRTPGAGLFMAYDLRSRRVIFSGGRPTGFRSIAVDRQGNAYFANGSGLQRYDPRANRITQLSVSFPSGGWMRASTPESSTGWMYGVTREPEMIFRFNPSTNQLEELGPAWGYTTAVALDPTERYMYYIPGAHGSSWQQGTPVLQFDLERRQHKVIAFLNQFYQPQRGYTLGGTYGLSLDPEGRRLFISMNASTGSDRTTGFGSPVQLVVNIPPSEAPVVTRPPLRFQDVTSQAGLIQPLLGNYVHSAAWGDADADGWPDLFVGMFTDSNPSYYQRRGATGASPNRLLFNRNGSFQNSGQSAIEIFGRASGAVLADLDNDGDLDLVVTNNRVPSSTNTRTLEPNRLYRNTGSGTYQDVSTTSGIRLADASARAIGVLDYNNDGLLDLFIVADALRGGGTSKLLRNRGNLIFDDQTAAAGLPTNVNGLGIAVGDPNGDGWPDFFVAGGPSDDYARNYLFVNNRNGTFREVNPGSFRWTTNGAEDYTSGATFGDVNRDGRLDLLVTHHFGSSEAQNRSTPPRLYLNTGNDGSGNPIFQDVTSAAGLSGVTTKAPHGELQDFDNDGWPDLYLSIKAETASGPTPFIYRHTGTLTNGRPNFAPPTYSSLLYYPGGPTVDYNRDGRLDVFGNEFRPENPPPLFANAGAPGNWLDIKVDAGPSRMGLGAKVKIFRAGQVGQASALLGFQEVQVGNGFSSASPAVVHFGLGNETSVDVEITMPFGGQVYRRQNIPGNRLLVMPNGAVNPPAWQGLEATVTSDTSQAFLQPPSFSPPTPYTVAATAPTVDFVVYPHPNYSAQGLLWSNWGRTLFASNGRFYSAIGDEVAPDGNSYVYEYDPLARRLRAVGDIQTATNHVPGSWGHGKIHAALLEADDGYLYTTSYWGSAANVVFDDYYRGSVILRYPLHTAAAGGAPPPPPTPPPGDFNNDGRVNAADLDILKANLSPPGPYNATYDLNNPKDGRVNWSDAGILLGYWTG